MSLNVGEENMILFESVYVTKVKTVLVWSREPPFDTEKIASKNPEPPGKTLSVIWYIDLCIRTKDGTESLVKVYK